MANKRGTARDSNAMPHLRRRVLIGVCFALALFTFAFSSLLLIAAARGAEQVDVELVFVSDASLSIDGAEIKFQREGYAGALLHPDVLAATKRGGLSRIAVTFIEWADEETQDVVVAWQVIDGEKSATRFGKALLAAPRTAYGINAIGAAIAAGQRTIETNAYQGLRKVIDFSGDSANNWGGISIAETRANALAAGITINGLPVECPGDDCSGSPVGYDLEKAFREQIIGGPGSFVAVADKNTSFAEAVRRKLILELASRSRHLARNDYGAAPNRFGPSVPLHTNQ
jgi:hypothetical protein